MKFTFSTLSALLLVGATSAVPFSDERQMDSSNRHNARSLSPSEYKHSPLLPVNYTGPAHRINTASAENSSGEKSISYSGNWAGGISTDSGITFVQAGFYVPAISIPPGGDENTKYGGAAWVGTGGTSASGGQLFQVGIYWTIQGNKVLHSPLFDWLPQPDSQPDMEINEGDLIYVRLATNGPTAGTAYITNESTGVTITETFSGEGALSQATAEWIVEDFMLNGKLVPFAAFEPVTFMNAGYWNGQGNFVGPSETVISDIVGPHGTVVTNCGVTGEYSLECSYTGP